MALSSLQKVIPVISCFDLMRYERGLCQMGPSDDDVTGTLQK